MHISPFSVELLYSPEVGGSVPVYYIIVSFYCCWPLTSEGKMSSNQGNGLSVFSVVVNRTYRAVYSLGFEIKNHNLYILPMSFSNYLLFENY